MWRALSLRKSKKSKTEERLLDAALAGDVDKLTHLIHKTDDVSTPREDGCTALHAACNGGHVECMRLLLEAGADALKLFQGWTVLHVAAAAGQQQCAMLLLRSQLHRQHIDTNEGEPDRRTALHLAAVEGHLDVVKALLGAGANPELRDRTGRTCLHLALEQNQHDVAKFLIFNKIANVNVYDLRLTTPLMIASARGNAELIALLLQAGADPNAVDEHQRTASDLAQLSNQEECLQLLRAAEMRRRPQTLRMTPSEQSDMATSVDLSVPGSLTDLRLSHPRTSSIASSTSSDIQSRHVPRTSSPNRYGSDTSYSPLPELNIPRNSRTPTPSTPFSHASHQTLQTTSHRVSPSVLKAQHDQTDSAEHSFNAAFEEDSLRDPSVQRPLSLHSRASTSLASQVTPSLLTPPRTSSGNATTVDLNAVSLMTKDQLILTLLDSHHRWAVERQELIELLHRATESADMNSEHGQEGLDPRMLHPTRPLGHYKRASSGPNTSDEYLLYLENKNQLLAAELETMSLELSRYKKEVARLQAVGGRAPSQPSDSSQIAPTQDVLRREGYGSPLRNSCSPQDSAVLRKPKAYSECSGGYSSQATETPSQLDLQDHLASMEALLLNQSLQNKPRNRSSLDVLLPQPSPASSASTFEVAPTFSSEESAPVQPLPTTPTLKRATSIKDRRRSLRARQAQTDL
eukprot:m.452908 g.452908  ORF g.452908 m.452908 type:complete len:688 (-) comp56928_c0_seq29:1562-3625(-)